MRACNNTCNNWHHSRAPPSFNTKYSHLIAARLPLIPLLKICMKWLIIVTVRAATSLSLKGHSLRAFSALCAICAWFSSTPRLPVAPYKNSFSVTEWRIRLGGNGQSSGTPLKNVCPALFYFCPFISAPVETTVQRALGHVSSAARQRLNLVRYCQEFSCSVEKLILYL